MSRVGTMMTIEDNWRSAEPNQLATGGGWWTGFTVLVLQGRALPWESPPRDERQDEDDDEETMDDPELSDPASSVETRATRGSDSRSRSSFASGSVH